jgi:hypothetical protein
MFFLTLEKFQNVILIKSGENIKKDYKLINLNNADSKGGFDIPIAYLICLKKWRSSGG